MNQLHTKTIESLVDVLHQHQQINAAAVAMEVAPHTSQAVAALPEEFKLHDLERYQPTRRRMAGTYTTRNIQPFADFVQQYADAGATVFVDADEMTAFAVLDLGTIAAPGHADHRAKLTPKRTAAYTALRKIIDFGKSQREIAEFFEDWNGIAQLQFFAEAAPDGTPGEEIPPSEEIPLRRAIAALRAVDIKTTTGMEGRVEQLSSSLSAFEQVKASSKDTLPAEIHFICRPYADLQERRFILRLSVMASEKGPALTLRIKNLERHEEEMAEELGGLVQQAIDAKTESDSVDDPVPVLLGTYSKG